jgi:nuclear pore complex protein Nup160
VFPEFLLASCQHLLIQEYVRLLHGWCEWNNCSRKFLLGSALLDMGEPYKAYDLLVQAAKGITTDDFMATKLVPSTGTLSEQRLLVLYYLKVCEFVKSYIRIQSKVRSYNLLSFLKGKSRLVNKIRMIKN